MALDKAGRGQLLRNLLLFGRVLRGLGLDGSPARMIDLATALGLLDLGRKRDVYHTMRALIVRRREDIAAFDEAFAVFWRKPAEGSTTLDLRAMGERRRFRRPRFDPPAPPGAAADGAE
ncbi:MAG: VWA domain-containing protein, partial [Thermoanaerobaculia bacterium]